MKKLLHISSIIFLVLAANTNIAESTETNNFSVTFKKGTNEKYVKLVNLFTNTKIKEKISSEKYIFTIDKALVNKSDKNYSDLLSMIPEVESIQPRSSNTLINKKSGDYVDGLILVKYKNNISKQNITKIDSKYKTKSVLFSKELNLYKVSLPVNLTVDKAVAIFSKLAEVQYAEPDRVMKIQKKNNISISFKDNDENYRKILENILEINLNQENKVYTTMVSDKYDPEQFINALKVSPFIMDVKQDK